MFSSTKPAKLLQCNMTSFFGVESWPFDDGTGEDLWFLNQNSYRWDIELDITSQGHSSHLTRNPFQYTGLDVKIGDWISGTSNGVALKIISISSKTDSSISCTVEDVDRFNTFHDATSNGIGIFPIGNCLIFSLGGDGLPILLPMPQAGTLSQNFAADLISRFRINNPVRRFRFEQIAHGFDVGDEIVMNPSTELFEKSSVSNLNIVGRIVEVDSGPDTFLLDPVTKIREDIFPPLPGTIGDIIFIDPLNPGELTTTFSGPGSKAAFIRLSDSVAATITSSIPDATGSINDVLEINDVDVTFTTGTATIPDIAIDITALVGSHGVTATSITAPSFTIGTVSNPFNDINAGAVIFTINGTPISLVTDDNGFGFPVIDDFIVDINALTGTHGIIASNDGGLLKLEDPTGAAIVIVDISPPAAPIATATRKGFTISTGLSNAPLSTALLLVLTADDGRQILLRDKTGQPILNLGLFSVENGKLPIGLVIEQSAKTTESFVVADIPARDALTVGVGDTVFVLDKGDNEWGSFIFDGSVFVIISTEESARTDSRSLSVDITPSSSLTTLLGEVSTGSRVNPVTIEVLTPFNGVPVMQVGDATIVDRLFEDALVDLTIVGTYESTPAFQYTSGNDTEINVTFNANGATVGLARVTITYS